MTNLPENVTALDASSTERCQSLQTKIVRFNSFDACTLPAFKPVGRKIEGATSKMLFGEIGLQLLATDYQINHTESRTAKSLQFN